MSGKSVYVLQGSTPVLENYERNGKLYQVESDVQKSREKNVPSSIACLAKMCVEQFSSGCKKREQEKSGLDCKGSVGTLEKGTGWVRG